MTDDQLRAIRERAEREGEPIILLAQAIGEPYCHASRGDGECTWAGCPQMRDGEPLHSGRHCPLALLCACDDLDGGECENCQRLKSTVNTASDVPALLEEVARLKGIETAARRWNATFGQLKAMLAMGIDPARVVAVEEQEWAEFTAALAGDAEKGVGE
jgi:hypothetical protein